MDWENHLEKNPIQKSKTVKIRVKLPHVKKPLPRNRIFVQTPFPHSNLKLERTKFTPQNHSLSLHFLFRRDQNLYSNLTSKIMKMCEQILKKLQRTNTDVLTDIPNRRYHAMIPMPPNLMRAFLGTYNY